MENAIQHKLLTRKAVKVYDPEYKMSEAALLEILEAANQAHFSMESATLGISCCS